MRVSALDETGEKVSVTLTEGYSSCAESWPPELVAIDSYYLVQAWSWNWGSTNQGSSAGFDERNRFPIDRSKKGGYSSGSVRL